MYRPESGIAEEFIDDQEIKDTLAYADANKELILSIIEKAKKLKGISHREASVLLACEDKELIQKVFDLAIKIKEEFYGNRIVMFAPLYLANYCVNGCTYCPYHYKNKHIRRKKLTQEEIKKEVIALQDMGHKRLALETGEDPVNIPIEYVLESIKTIYSIKHKNGAIRRVNVNIAATTVENYKKLKDVGIGTYILFQETYHKDNYEVLHPTGPKHDYAYHTEAMDRAMTAGIDDVGIGVLFGLDMYAINDDIFEKIVAILRIAVPYTGIIVSTRETQESRERVLKVGVSQISGASSTSVGGYAEKEKPEDNSAQFEKNDNRTLDEIIGWLMDLGHIPSFCTACYREGRTGDRFMTLVKSGQIANCCAPNALMTLKEYLEDYASDEVKAKGEVLIKQELEKIPNPVVKQKATEYIENIHEGKRDFRF